MFITHCLYPLSLRGFPTPLNYESHKFALASRQQYCFETELLILNPGTVTGYYLPTSIYIYMCVYIAIYRSVSPYNLRTIRAEYATVVFACTTLPPKPPTPHPKCKAALQNVKSLTRNIKCLGRVGSDTRERDYQSGNEHGLSPTAWKPHDSSVLSVTLLVTVPYGDPTTMRVKERLQPLHCESHSSEATNVQHAKTHMLCNHNL